MKITKVDRLYAQDPAKSTNTSNKPDGSFSVCLDDMLSMQQAAESTVGSVQGPGLLDPPGNLLDNINSSETVGNKVMEKLSYSLDHLDAFAKMLGSVDFDPAMADETIRNVIQKIIHTREESSIAEDDVLRNIGEEIKMCSFLESIKWKRGDYL